MTPRSLRLLAVALGALLLLWGAVAVASRNGRDTEQRLRLPTITTADVDTVTFAGARDTVVLARAGKAWLVNGHPTDPQAIEELVTALGATSAAGDLVAENASSYAQLGMDSASARHVRIVAHGKTVLDIVTGKPGVVYGTGYLRPVADPAVYLVRSSLPRIAERGVDGWRDKRIAAVPGDSVSKIEIQRGARRYALSRKGAGWTLAPGGATDSMEVANFLRALADIRAAGFASPSQADSVRFSPPTRRLRVLGRDGAPRVSLVFDSTAAGLWARADSGGTVWRLEGWSVDQLTPADSTLAARPARALRKAALTARARGAPPRR
ncbi:MAG: DUF4340 domain-containing protein [Deltaproteobacteria bacterium]